VNPASDDASGSRFSEAIQEVYFRDEGFSEARRAKVDPGQPDYSVLFGFMEKDPPTGG